MCTAACGLVMVTRTRSPLSLSRDSDATGGISRVFWTVSGTLPGASGRSRKEIALHPQAIEDHNVGA